MENEYKLDDEWIKNFEKSDQLYKDFYTDDVYYTNLHLVYVNKNSEIETIKQDKFIMQTPNLITKEEIIGILKRNNVKDNKTFTIMTMLKYNFDLEPTEVRNFLLNNDCPDYLSVVKDVDEIVWNRTISMFQDLNNLFIIFYENEKIKMQQQKTDATKTKRIYFNANSYLNSHNKTLKKKLKTI